MVKMEDAVVARYEHLGHKFEILVDPGLALNLRQGKKVNFDEMLAMDSVYKDAAKGEVASEEIVKKTFGSNDIKEIAKKIVVQGDIQLTTEQRRAMIESKRKEIVAFIAENALNPQTNAPHPPQRIENALGELRVQVDLFKPVPEQVQEVLKGLKKLLPISFKKLRIAVKIPAEYAGKATPFLHKFNAQKQEWQNDGSIVALFELPAGLKNKLFDELNHLTHGNVDSKILDN